MLTAQWPRWSTGLLALLLLTGQQSTSTPPTLAQVRQAFTAAHPASVCACADGTPFVTLNSPRPTLACLVGEDELTLCDGRHLTSLALAPHAGSYRTFDVALAGRDIGSYSTCYDDQSDEVQCFDLVLGRATQTALGEPVEARFVALDDSAAFTARLRRSLGGTDAPPPAVGTLNDTGYLLQRAGYVRAALPVLTAVVHRAPSRAVAYLNRGDVYWQLDRPAAAQADYRRYVTLLRTQHKDTTRIPPYVRLVLRLPTR
jgi:hypothetical protein